MTAAPWLDEPDVLDPRRFSERSSSPGSGEELDRGAAEYSESMDHLVRMADATAGVRAERTVAGGDFILDGSAELEARWGTQAQLLWACGESLLIVAPPGVGKTTMAVQLVEALVGITDRVLDLPVRPARRVLYLAMDRPRQIRRAMARRFTATHRDVLNERLVVHKGPLPGDLAKFPEQLVTLAHTHDSDVIVVDSLKDACAKLTDDEAGSMVNRAVQMCNAADIDLLGLHHQRKGQNGNKPNTLADVYGSTWITAGAGSVVLLWGEAGSEIVELSHLKQPADTVGPWTIEHDHHHGTSRISRAFDALGFLRRHPGCTVADAAHAEHGAAQKAGSAPWKRTERRMRRLVIDGYARADAQHRSGGAFDAVRYWPVDASLEALLTVDTDRGQGGSDDGDA